jgi:hypothetical protein
MICLAALGMLATSTAAAGEADEPVRLAYRAPDGCPAKDAFLAEVRRSAPRMRLARPDEPARLFAVAIDDDGRHGRLTIEGEGRARVRDAEGANCAEVSRLLAFATALAVDPEAVAPADVPMAAPPEPRPEATNGPRIDRTERADAAAPGAPLSWSAGGYALAEGASAPTPLIGGGAFGELGGKMGSIRPAVRLGIGYAASAPAFADDARVTFSSILGLLEACPTTWGTRRASLRPCLRMEGGSRLTAGHDIPEAQAVRRPWFALGAAAHVRWFVAGLVFAELSGGALFPVVRDRVYLAPGTTVHEVPWIGGMGEFALGVDFGDQVAR